MENGVKPNRKVCLVIMFHFGFHPSYINLYLYNTRNDKDNEQRSLPKMPLPLPPPPLSPPSLDF